MALVSAPSESLMRWSPCAAPQFQLLSLVGPGWRSATRKAAFAPPLPDESPRVAASLPLHPIARSASASPARRIFMEDRVMVGRSLHAALSGASGHRLSRR